MKDFLISILAFFGIVGFWIILDIQDRTVISTFKQKSKEYQYGVHVKKQLDKYCSKKENFIKQKNGALVCQPIINNNFVVIVKDYKDNQETIFGKEKVEKLFPPPKILESGVSAETFNNY